MLTYKTNLQQGDRKIELNETYKPEGLAAVMGAHRGQFENLDMARGITGHGNLDLYVGVTERSPNDYVVNVTLDKSRDKTASRDVRVASGFIKIGEYFSKVPVPEAGPTRAVPVPEDEDETENAERRIKTPRPSLLGDFSRAVGDTVGFFCDVVWAGIRWCGRKIQSLVSEP